MKKCLAQKTKTFLVALSALALLAVLLAVGSSVGGVKLLSRENVSTAEKRAAFLRECGWEVDLVGEQCQQILIPEQFNDVFDSYNRLQRQQGYDLAEYAGRSCELYTYPVTNYPDKEQTVLAALYVFKGRVIGGDIHSTNMNGFMVGLK